MNCQNCGREVTKGMICCPGCGKKLRGEAWKNVQNTCRRCGNVLVPGAAFCICCGEKTNGLGTENRSGAQQGAAYPPYATPAASKTGIFQKKYIPWIIIAISGLVIAAVVITMLLLNYFHTDSHTEVAKMPEVRSTDAYEINACGDWYMYSGGILFEDWGRVIGYDTIGLHLKNNGEASITAYYADSDSYYSYSGTWTYETVSECILDIDIELYGGYTGSMLPDDIEDENKPYIATLSVNVAGDWMTIVSVSGSTLVIESGNLLQKNYTPEQWAKEVVIPTSNIE